jgi:hypothetical protein
MQKCTKSVCCYFWTVTNCNRQQTLLSTNLKFQDDLLALIELLYEAGWTDIKKDGRDKANKPIFETW